MRHLCELELLETILAAVGQTKASFVPCPCVHNRQTPLDARGPCGRSDQSTSESCAHYSFDVTLIDRQNAVTM